jgi:hypothetical protein
VFWLLQLSFEVTGVPKDSKFPFLGVRISSSHLLQSGVATHYSDLGEAITFPLIVYFAPFHGAHIQMTFLSQDSRVGVPKLRQMGLPRLWSPIALRADLGLRCSLKQSCSSYWELSNGILHVVCRQVNRVDSQLFLVESQIGSLIIGPSFGHNLCFRCPNEQCKPILDIYVPRSF